MREHEFSLEVPGRHGSTTVTGVCSCRLWLSSVHLGHVGIPDVEAAEARLRELFRTYHGAEVPDLDATAERVKRIEAGIEDQRDRAAKGPRQEAMRLG